MTQEQYWDLVEKALLPQAVRELGISEKEAKLRVEAIIKSGILSKFGKPDEPKFQIAIDAAMQIPQLGRNEG